MLRRPASVKNGKPTNEQAAFRIIIRDIRKLYGDQPATEFGPLALKAVREVWIDRGQSRQSINKNMRRVTRMFKWAVAEELIPPGVYQALAAVPGLRKGRCTVRESPPVMPVPLEAVERTMESLPKILKDMVRVQLLTGMRPGEVCGLRPGDIDRSDDVWEYRPETHKTEHHGRARIVYLGPEAQAVLAPYLLRGPEDHCFSPEEAMRNFLEAKHNQRTTPLSCGNRPGTNRKASPRKIPGAAYTPNSYRHAIHRDCDRTLELPPRLGQRERESRRAWRRRLSADQLKELKELQAANRWSPNQLRHTAATSIRKQFGLEGAQVILGHAAADVTQVYAERDADKARDIARQIG